MARGTFIIMVSCLVKEHYWYLTAAYPITIGIFLNLQGGYQPLDFDGLLTV